MKAPEEGAVLSALRLAPGMALVFDLDGVVVNSMPVHTLAWERYLQSLGVNGHQVESRMHGRRNDEIVRDFLGPDISPSVVSEHGAAKERLYRELMGDEIDRHLVPGIREFLERSSGVPKALATNAEAANVDFVLNRAGMRSLFASIVDGSQVKSAKPAPDVYLLSAKRLGVDPANCIVFEDSPVGIDAARAAGMRVVGLLTTAVSLDRVDLAVPDFLHPELEPWLASQEICR